MTHTDLQLDWLRAFVAVVDGGSLSAAAPRQATPSRAPAPP